MADPRAVWTTALGAFELSDDQMAVIVCVEGAKMPRQFLEQKRRAREAAICAIPMMVCCFTWYMIPFRGLAVAFFYIGALILGRAAVMWWRPDLDDRILRWVFIALAVAGMAAIRLGWFSMNPN